MTVFWRFAPRSTDRPLFLPIAIDASHTSWYMQTHESAFNTWENTMNRLIALIVFGGALSLIIALPAVAKTGGRSLRLCFRLTGLGRRVKSC